LVDDLRSNRLTGAAVSAARDLLKREGGRARHLVFGGMIQQGNIVKMQLFAVNRRGRTMRLEVLETDSDFFGVSVELEPIVRQLRGPFRGKAVSEVELFKGISRPKTQARVVTFTALSKPLGSFEAMLRDEDKEEDLGIALPAGKKVRRPVLRRRGAASEFKESGAERSVKTFSDFKDDDDK
jgi:hypothetical protein